MPPNGDVSGVVFLHNKPFAIVLIIRGISAAALLVSLSNDLNTGHNLTMAPEALCTVADQMVDAWLPDSIV